MLAAPDAGYIMIELIAALVLMGLLALIAFPVLSQSTSAPRYRALLVDTATLLRQARNTAIARGEPAYVTFDHRRILFKSGSRSVAVPRDVEVGLMTGSRCVASAESTQIVFRADGTNCGGVFRFVRGGHAARIRTNWLTGHVEILQDSN